MFTADICHIIAAVILHTYPLLCSVTEKHKLTTVAKTVLKICRHEVCDNVFVIALRDLMC